MIYAKVDVKLRDHERAHRAGAAMATWTWALLYSVEQETDGFVPEVVLRGAWVGEKDALRHAVKLVEVGLWEKVPGGWLILRFTDKNASRAEVATRRAEAAERMARVRANRSQSVRTNIDRTITEQPESEQRAVPGSGSGSGSGLGSREGESERETADPAPPEWFVQAAETAGMVVGTIDNLPAKWLTYKASRGRKGWAKNHEDAVGWLVDVAGRERREASEKRAREAKWDKQRAGPGSLNEPNTVTPEESKRLAEAFAARVAARKAKGAA